MLARMGVQCRGCHVLHLAAARRSGMAGRAGGIPAESDPDGFEFLLSPLDGRPETYQAWVADYYECDVELATVEHVYRHQPLTAEVVAGRTPRCPWATWMRTSARSAILEQQASPEPDPPLVWTFAAPADFMGPV